MVAIATFASAASRPSAASSLVACGSRLIPTPTALISAADSKMRQGMPRATQARASGRHPGADDNDLVHSLLRRCQKRGHRDQTRISLLISRAATAHDKHMPMRLWQNLAQALWRKSGSGNSGRYRRPWRAPGNARPAVAVFGASELRAARLRAADRGRNSAACRLASRQGCRGGEPGRRRNAAMPGRKPSWRVLPPASRLRENESRRCRASGGSPSR